MKLNYFFLISGIILSVISKILQFVFDSKVGDGVVIISAIFFILSLSFSIEAFSKLFYSRRRCAIKLLINSCISIVSFQIMMILIVGNGIYHGIIFVIPFLIFGCLSVFGWIQLHKVKR
ncbi:MAG: hypothetical protein ACRCX2_05180 [Paraclostridium sp.]